MFSIYNRQGETVDRLINIRTAGVPRSRARRTHRDQTMNVEGG